MSSPWKDHFCHPCERAYEVPELREIIEKSGFKVIHLNGQGREEEWRLPEEWRQPYKKLNEWDRYRLMELLSPPRSFSMILVRK